MKAILAAGVTSLAVLASPVAAQDRKGDVQVKILATGVLPDGKITDLEVPLPGVTDGLQTEANDNYVPTVAVEYFFTDNFSIETICCLTQHDVDGTRGLPGAELVSDAMVIPATLTGKYHIDLGGAKPYLGAGFTYFIWVDVDRGKDTIPLGVTKTSFSDEFGFVLQAGLDVPINDKAAITLDAKRYWVDTTARWFAGDTVVIKTEHELDPWVLSAGVALRF